MKTLTIVAPGLGRPEKKELYRLETADLCPRLSLFDDTLNSDMLDEQFMATAPALRRSLYKVLDTASAQVMEAYLLRNRYDAVISWAGKHSILYAALLKFTGAHAPHVALTSWLSKGKRREMWRHLHPWMDRIVLWSSVQYEYGLRSLGIPESKLVLVKLPVDQKFWRPMPDAGDMICTVGRENRDCDTFLAAIRQLDIRCHIAAGTARQIGNDWQAAIHRSGPLPPHVTMGRKPYLDLRALYTRSRFVVVPVLPTDTDNGATCILESMAMGKAVICSRVEGQRDIIRDGVTGIYVPPGDPDALRDAILDLWKHPGIAERMGREGRAYIEQHHTLDQFVVKIRSIVGEVIDEYRSMQVGVDLAGVRV